MEEFSRELPDLGGAAVRGEAVALTDAEIGNFWMSRDCMDAIRAGDVVAQFVSAFRAGMKALGVSARAADALDSQPTDCEITYLIKGYPGGWWECGKGSYDNAAEGDRKIIYEKSAQASSQPTDGGVRNG